MAPKRKSQAQESEPKHETGSDEPPAKKQQKLDAHFEINKDRKDGAKEEVKADKEPTPELVKEKEQELEEDDQVIGFGRVFFLYKPRVNVENPKSIDDVARLHIVLRSSDDITSLIIVGRKYLPNPDSGYIPIWAFIKEVSNAKDVKEDIVPHLKDSEYETKTKGMRHNPEDRVIGEGPYALVLQKGKNASDTKTSLCYVLEAPSEIGQVQVDFNIEQKGQIGLCVRNPSTPAPPQAGLRTPAKFPEHLQSKFSSRRWNPVDDVEFLQTENAEILLLAQKSQLDSAMPEEELEAIAQEATDDVDGKNEEVKLVAQKIFEELGARVSKSEIEPSPIKGTWS